MSRSSICELTYQSEAATSASTTAQKTTSKRCIFHVRTTERSVTLVASRLRPRTMRWSQAASTSLTMCEESSTVVPRSRATETTTFRNS
jgi:hypothetical protein